MAEKLTTDTARSAEGDNSPDPLTQEAEKLLELIEIYPGENWPNAYVAERALLHDAMEHREGSPWMGGTRASALFIAGAPSLVQRLTAKVRELEQKNTALIKQVAISSTAQESAEATRTALEAEKALYENAQCITCAAHLDGTASTLADKCQRCVALEGALKAKS